MTETERIILVGGSDNGKILTVRGVPMVWRMPVVEPLTLASYDPDPGAVASAMKIHDYHPALDAYYRPSRRDDGVLVYELDPDQQAAFLAEQRQQDVPPVVAGCRLSFVQDDPTAPFAYPLTLACN